MEFQNAALGIRPNPGPNRARGPSGERTGNGRPKSSFWLLCKSRPDYKGAKKDSRVSARWVKPTQRLCLATTARQEDMVQRK